jgi:hypothetical protein
LDNLTAKYELLKVTSSKTRIQNRELQDDIEVLKIDLKESKSDTARDQYMIKELETRMGQMR